MNHHGLLAGELTLTLEIVLGLVLGEIVMKLRIAELIMKRFIPRSINPGTKSNHIEAGSMVNVNAFISFIS